MTRRREARVMVHVPIDNYCPKCRAIGKLMICPFMRGGTLANGERLDYYRCGACNILVSSLALQEMVSDATSGER